MKNIKIRKHLTEPFKAFRRDISESAGALTKQSERRTVFLKKLFFGLVVSFVFSILFAFVADLKQGGMDLYGTVVISIFALTALTVFITAFYNSSIGFTLICVFYIYFGVALQVLIKLPANDPSTADLILQTVVGFLAAVIAVPLMSCVSKNRKVFIYLLTALSCVIYLLLLIVGRKQNNGEGETNAWMKLFGISIQPTELTKLFFLLVVGLILSSKKASDKRKVLSITIVFLVHAAGLFFINEFGTLIIMFICYFIACVVYLSKLKWLWITIGAFVLIVLIGVVMTNACYKVKYGKADSRSSIVSIFKTSKENESLTEEEAKPEAAALAEEKARKEAPKKNFFVENGAKIYIKFYDRVAVMVRPEDFENTAAAYQRTQADKALLYSGAFGKEYGVIVPIIKSDFIFLYVLMKLGGLVGLLALLGMGFMFILVAPQILKKNKSAQGNIAFILLTMMVVQSFLNAASALGIIPTIGVNFTFLSAGGTAAIIHYCAMLFIIYALRDTSATKTVAQQRFKKKEENENV